MADFQPDQPTQPRPGEALDVARLSAFFQKNGLPALTDARQFPGGFSNLTYFLETETGGGYVLRRPPFGAQIKGGHDMGREFRVLTTLQAVGFPKIPKPVLFCDDETVLGAPFYVMERVNGVILRAASAASPALTPALMRRLGETLLDTLADLHALDVQKTGLLALGKPEGYVRRQVEGWIGRYEKARTDAIPAMDELAAWLRQHVPPEQPPAFLHNDFKFDNVVLSPDLTRIEAILDWEMATVGDPLMDLGASLAYWCEAADPDFLKAFNLTHLPGCPTRREVAHRYAARTGRDLTHLPFYYAFGLYKNAVILQQIYARWKMGLTRDPRFGKLLPGVVALGRMGVEAVGRGAFP
jgi:aminoglycoside phosphotransferase (APT) family kinase protein